MEKNITKFIIQGTTKTGQTFRPSDWIDRMSSAHGSFGSDKKLGYSSYLSPLVVDSKRSLVVSMALKEHNPDAFAEIVQFVQDNNLNVIDEEGKEIDIRTIHQN